MRTWFHQTQLIEKLAHEVKYISEIDWGLIIFFSEIQE